MPGLSARQTQTNEKIGPANVRQRQRQLPESGVLVGFIQLVLAKTCKSYSLIVLQCIVQHSTTGGGCCGLSMRIFGHIRSVLVNERDHSAQPFYAEESDHGQTIHDHEMSTVSSIWQERTRHSQIHRTSQPAQSAQPSPCLLISFVSKSISITVLSAPRPLSAASSSTTTA